MNVFNKDFDASFGKGLIARLKANVGCFSCHKPDPTRKCSKCQLARYCNRDCQFQDWKHGDHKEDCSTWCENRTFTDGSIHSIPVCMKACAYIREEDFVLAMRVRTELFMEEMRRLEPNVSLQVSCIPMLGKIRLVVGAGLNRVIDGEPPTLIFVNHVLLETIDEGDTAVAHLQQGTGTLSDSAKEKALQGLCVVAALLKDNGANVRAITFGRGLMFIDKNFEEKVNAFAGMKPFWIPDIRYRFEDDFNETLLAVFGAAFGMYSLCSEIRGLVFYVRGSFQ